MSKVITSIPEAHGSRWRDLADTLRRFKVVHPGFTGEVKINLRDGGVSTVIRTEVVRGA